MLEVRKFDHAGKNVRRLWSNACTKSTLIGTSCGKWRWDFQLTCLFSLVVVRHAISAVNSARGSKFIFPLHDVAEIVFLYETYYILFAVRARPSTDQFSSCNSTMFICQNIIVFYTFVLFQNGTWPCRAVKVFCFSIFIYCLSNSVAVTVMVSREADKYKMSSNWRSKTLEPNRSRHDYKGRRFFVVGNFYNN